MTFSFLQICIGPGHSLALATHPRSSSASTSSPSSTASRRGSGRVLLLARDPPSLLRAGRVLGQQLPGGRSACHGSTGAVALGSGSHCPAQHGEGRRQPEVSFMLLGAGRALSPAALHPSGCVPLPQHPQAEQERLCPATGDTLPVGAGTGMGTRLPAATVFAQELSRTL